MAKGSMVAVVFSHNELKTTKSDRNNMDREAVRKFINNNKIGNVHITPNTIVGLNNILHDSRLTAFIVGVSVESVEFAIRGDLFPEGMLFTTKYVGDIIGAHWQNIRDIRIKIYPNRPELHNTLISSEEAFMITERLKYKYCDDFYTAVETRKILGITIAIENKMLNQLTVYGKKGGGVTRYRKSVIDTLKERILIGFSVDNIYKKLRMLSGVKSVGETDRLSFFFPMGEKSFKGVPSDWERVIGEVELKGMKSKEIIRDVYKALSKRSSEIERELIKLNSSI